MLTALSISTTYGHTHTHFLEEGLIVVSSGEFQFQHIPVELDGAIVLVELLEDPWLSSVLTLWRPSSPPLGICPLPVPAALCLLVLAFFISSFGLDIILLCVATKNTNTHHCYFFIVVTNPC